MNEQYRKALLQEVAPLFKVKGFRRNGVRFLRSLGPVFQVVRFVTIPSRTGEGWMFHIYEGSSTPRLVKAMFSSDSSVPDPEHGPFFMSSRLWHLNNPEPFEIRDDATQDRVRSEVSDLLASFVLPLLDELRSPVAIVHLLEQLARDSFAARERFGRALSAYKAGPMADDVAEARAAATGDEA